MKELNREVGTEKNLKHSTCNSFAFKFKPLKTLWSLLEGGQNSKQSTSLCLPSSHISTKHFFRGKGNQRIRELDLFLNDCREPAYTTLGKLTAFKWADTNLFLPASNNFTGDVAK